MAFQAGLFLTSLGVITASTPGIASAAVVSMEVMVPAGTVLCLIAMKAWLGMFQSSPKGI
jgi:hypothetical protein